MLYSLDFQWKLRGMFIFATDVSAPLAVLSSYAFEVWK